MGLDSYNDWFTNKYKPVYNLLEETIKESKFEITEVISGTCWGVDQLGELWAKNNNIPLIKCPADWSLGKRAGFIRNEQMANIGDGLICICTNDSKGSRHMIRTMEQLNKPVFVRYV